MKKKFIVAAAVILIGGLVVFILIFNQKINHRDQSNASNELSQDRLNEARKADNDLDGLLDSDEKKYGTSQQSADSDADGLLDADEILLYKTDPAKADTYSLGQSDGWGVAHGVILPAGKIDKSKLK